MKPRDETLGSSKHPMRVLILTIYHDPEPIPKTGELARELRDRGHEVHVVTAFPHYPAGRLYPNYRLALWRRELRDGIPVLRTFIYPYHGKRSLLRILNYVSWMFSSMQAIWLTPRCDVMYVWHPPLTVGVTARVVSAFKRMPFVYDVQDLWPESAIASGLMRPGLLTRALERLASWVYRQSPRLLVVSEEAAEHLAARGVDRHKLTVAKHWIDTRLFTGPSSGRDVRRELGLNNRFVIMFAGNLGLVQGLETAIAAARLLVGQNVVMVLVGDGSDAPRLRALASDLPNVVFTGAHPPSAMPDFFSAADGLLLHLKSSDVAEHAVPTKLLAYLASGRPILCGTGGAARRIVAAARAGLIFPPGDPHAMCDAIVRLMALPPEARASLGTNGLSYFRREFDKKSVIDFYENVLSEAIQNSRPVSTAAR